MSKVKKIGNGIMLCSLFTMLKFTIIFGNDKEDFFLKEKKYDESNI